MILKACLHFLNGAEGARGLTVGVNSNSAIHKAAGSLVTGCSQKSCPQEPPPEVIPPLMASWLEQWNDGIVPVKSWNDWEL